MQITIHPNLVGLPGMDEAESIVRACVHCGFCNATCPTYQLTGNELDGPRGRIYLIRALLENDGFSSEAMVHLDRCLACRSCETTCPSGVTYGRLLDVGRELAEKKTKRSFVTTRFRNLLRRIIPFPGRFSFLLALGRVVRPLLPSFLADIVPHRVAVTSVPGPRHEREVLLLDGCVQSAATPNTTRSLARVLDRIGISARFAVKPDCCGALDYHLSEKESAQVHMKRLIDRCWPFVEEGVECIVSTASGCGVHLKEYGKILADDPDYGQKAERFSALIVDVSELLSKELSAGPGTGEEPGDRPRVAVHVPCSLQHGLQINGVVENLLLNLGVTLIPVAEGHLCCGSAGSYSILQPATANELRERKIANLESGQPDMIVTANVGCQLHLATATDTPVLHWVELVERLVTAGPSSPHNS